jgi:MFS-type transporter involved in bile tolerance (Atg22 family)
MDDQDDPNQYRIQVLSESAEFNMYLLIIALCPSMFWSLIIGSWIDKYYYAKKFLLLFCIFTLILDSSMMALQSYWFDMSMFTIFISSLVASNFDSYISNL